MGSTRKLPDYEDPQTFAGSDEQFNRFLDAAREAGCEENFDRFDDALRKVAKAKPEPKTPAPRKRSNDGHPS